MPFREDEGQPNTEAPYHRNEAQVELYRLRDSVATLNWHIESLRRELLLEQKVQPLLIDRRVGLWDSDEQAQYIHFDEPVEARTLALLVAAFNRRYAASFNLELELQGIDGSVAHVSISDGERLANRMGSTGSLMYMSTLTYTLTSYPAVDTVYLDIEGGSHAEPGYYSRRNWVDLVQE